MQWVFLSPHLDDVAYSCGGLIYHLALQRHRISIWTVCAGYPLLPLSSFAKSLHQRWQTGLDAIEIRRKEDVLACQELKANYKHFTIPDCIYRKHPQTGEPLYASEEAIFGPVARVEKSLIHQLARDFAGTFPSGCRLVFPLGLGGHVDHRLVLGILDQLLENSRYPVWFYADYPYVLKEVDLEGRLLEMGFSKELYPFSGKATQAWINAARSYVSQISTFWGSEKEIEKAFRGYAAGVGGVRLWQPTHKKTLSHILRKLISLYE